MGCGGSNASRSVAPGETVPKRGASLNDRPGGNPGADLPSTRLQGGEGDQDKKAVEAGLQHLPHWAAVARAMEKGYLREARRELET